MATATTISTPTQDVTNDFNQLCSLLQQGEMVKSPGFELSKAISAVEFFSAKMDAGVIPKRPQPEEITLRYQDLKIPEIIAITDRIWNLEIAYFEGSSLAQSVMTCLYAHAHCFRQSEQGCPLLHTLIAATLKSCSHTQQIVLQTQVCFEEDFLPGNLGIEQCGDNLDFKTICEKLIEQGATIEDQQLKSRILFRNSMMEAEQAMDKFNFETAEWYLQQALDELPRIKFSTEPSIVDFAFDPLVNLWRIVPQPPRPHVVYEASLQQGKWANLVQNLMSICQARHAVQNGTFRGELVSMFEELCRFSRTKRSLNALVRSRMFLAMCDEEKRIFGTAPWKSIIAKDVGLWGSDATSSFLDDSVTEQTAAQLIFEAFRVLCFNPARQRRRLVHRIEEFGSFQQRCEVVDAARMRWTGFTEWDPRKRQAEREKYSMPLGAWACEWCVRLMTRFLEIGAELELYRPRDAKSLTYYLFFIYRLAGEYHLASLKSRNLTSELEPSQKHPFAVSLRRIQALNECRRMVSHGNLQLLIALNSYEKSAEKDPKAVFDHPRMHFEHRFFDPFSTVWLPQALTWQDVFVAFRPGQKISIAMMLEKIDETYKTVKTICAELAKRPEFIKDSRAADDLKDIIRSAIKNGLACASFKNLAKGKEEIAYNAVYDTTFASLVTLTVEKKATMQ